MSAPYLARGPSLVYSYQMLLLLSSGVWEKWKKCVFILSVVCCVACVRVVLTTRHYLVACASPAGTIVLYEGQDSVHFSVGLFLAVFNFRRSVVFHPWAALRAPGECVTLFLASFPAISKKSSL